LNSGLISPHVKTSSPRTARLSAVDVGAFPVLQNERDFASAGQSGEPLDIGEDNLADSCIHLVAAGSHNADDSQQHAFDIAAPPDGGRENVVVESGDESIRDGLPDHDSAGV
jgi:hypothetical protein